MDLEDLIENVAGSVNLDSYSVIFCKPCTKLNICFMNKKIQEIMLNDMLLVSRRLSGATLLRGTWKHIQSSIPEFRFLCKMKKRTGKHSTLC